jgi:O-antigen/teichoic acid export membrane protein
MNSRAVEAGFLGFGRVMTSLAMLICFAGLSRLLTKTNYATYRQTLLAYQFIAPLLVLGLPGALNYFLALGQRDSRPLLVENVILLAITGAGFSLFLLAGGNEYVAALFGNPDLARTLVIIAPYSLFVLPALCVSSCLVATKRVKHLVVFRTATAGLTVGIVLLLAWQSENAEMPLLGLVAVSGITLIPALFLMFKACNIGSWRPSLSGIWQQLKFSLPLAIAGAAGALSLNLDKVIVSSFFGAEQFSIYVNGAIEVPLIAIVTASVSMVVLRDATTMLKDGRTQEALELWQRAATKCAVIILPAMFFLLLMAPELMRVLFSDEYSASATPFRIYLLLLPIRIVSFGVLLIAAGRSNLVLITSVVGLALNAALSLVLVQWVGYLGAAIATVITTYVWAVPFSMYCISRLTQHNILQVLPWRNVLMIAGISCLAIVPLALIKPQITLSDFAILPMAGIVYFAIVLVVLANTGYVNLESLSAHFLQRRVAHTTKP